MHFENISHIMLYIISKFPDTELSNPKILYEKILADHNTLPH